MGADAYIDMIELQANGGTIYAATVQGTLDGSGNVYREKLKESPELQLELPEDGSGVQNDGAITFKLGNLDQAYSATFRNTDQRGRTVIWRRKYLTTGTIDTLFTGQIDQPVFDEDGTINCAATNTVSEALEALYPRVLITKDTFPTATSETFAVNTPVPIILGAGREHTPARYVEAREESFGASATGPRPRNRFRYVASADLARSAGVPATVRPRINDVYRGTQLGVTLVPQSEWAEGWDLPLTTPSGLTATLQAGGTITVGWTLEFKLTAVGPCGETAATAATTLVTTSSGNQQVLLGWTRVRWAWGYRVYVSINSGTFSLLTEVAGGHINAFTWSDGTWTLDDARQVPTVNSTGEHTVDALFPSPQFSAESALAPILVDAETTELCEDQYTEALWLFRDGRLDDRSNRLAGSGERAFNHLITSGTVALWQFDNHDGTSETGNNTLTEVPVTATDFRWDDYRVGPYGKVIRYFNGKCKMQVAHASQTGLDVTTGNLRIKARIRTDPGTVDRARMTICAKMNTTLSGPGYLFDVTYGKLHAYIRTASASVSLFGTSKLDGGVHEVELRLDRTLDPVLQLWVDNVMEAEADASGITGSLTNTADFQVGRLSIGGLDDFFRGEMHYLEVRTNIVREIVADGKAGQGASALDFVANLQPYPYITDAKQSGLDAGTSDYTWEAWITVTGSVGASFRLICGKMPAGGGVGVRLGIFDSSGVKLQAEVNYGAGNNVPITTAALTLNEPHHVALRRVKGGGGDTLTLAIDGVLQSFGVGTGDLSNAADFLIGAANTSGTGFFPGSIDEIRCSRVARSDDELREAFHMGMRNPTRQGRLLLSSALHGPGLTCNAASWNTAEDAVELAAMKSDYVMVEQAPLRVHAEELARLRGLRITMAAGGALDCTADTQQAASATFGFRDGRFNNVPTRPTWSYTPLSEAKKKLRVKYRRRRRDDGSVDRYLMQAADRDVLTVGKAEPEEVEVPAIRDRVVGDRFAYYLGRRRVWGDERVAFSCGGDQARGLVPGKVVTLDDATSGRPNTLVEVRKVRLRGGSYDVDARRWNADIYAYSAGTLPAEVGADDSPDYSATPPPSATNLQVVFAATVQNDGSRVWTATLTWKNPTSKNFSEVVVAWSPADTSAWREIGTTTTQTATVVGGFDDGTSYDFRVVTRNAFGKEGLPATATVATTLPGAPANPDTASTPGAWTINLTSSGAGHRSRQFRWDPHPAKDLAYYEWEMYDASPTGGTLLRSGQTRSTRLVYQENGLLRTSVRGLQVRAVNKSGQASLYSGRVTGSSANSVTGGTTGDLGNNGTVATGDAATDAFTKPDSAFATGSVGTSLATMGTLTATLDGGLVLVQATIFVVASAGWLTTDQLNIELQKDGTPLLAPAWRGGGASSLIPLTLQFLDEAGSTGSHTYRVQLQRVGTGTLTASVYLTIVELKR